MLVITALIARNPAALDRIIKNARRHKFRRELANKKEIKADKSSPELREYLLKKLNEVEGNLAIHCILVKKKLRSEYLKDNKNRLYNYVAGVLAKAINIDADDVEVRVDRSKGKYLLREDFNGYFEERLRAGSIVSRIRIYHSYSENFSGIQFADLLAWVVYQKYNNSNSSYLDIIDKRKFPQKIIELWKSEN